MARREAESPRGMTAAEVLWALEQPEEMLQGFARIAPAAVAALGDRAASLVTARLVGGGSAYLVVPEVLDGEAWLRIAAQGQAQYAGATAPAQPERYDEVLARAAEPAPRVKRGERFNG